MRPTCSAHVAAAAMLLLAVTGCQANGGQNAPVDNLNQGQFAVQLQQQNTLLEKLAESLTLQAQLTNEMRNDQRQATSMAVSAGRDASSAVNQVQNDGQMMVWLTGIVVGGVVLGLLVIGVLVSVAVYSLRQGMLAGFKSVEDGQRQNATTTADAMRYQADTNATTLRELGRDLRANTAETAKAAAWIEHHGERRNGLSGSAPALPVTPRVAGTR